MRRLLLALLIVLSPAPLAAQEWSGGSGGGAPSGSAGGSLSGTYPNPTVVTNANLTGDVTSVGNATTLVNVGNASSGLLGSTLGGTGVYNAGTLTYSGSLTLGTAAVAAIGTSGATVPLLNGANTYSATQTFSGPASGPSVFINVPTSGASLQFGGSAPYVEATSFYISNTTASGGTYFTANPGFIGISTSNANYGYIVVPSTGIFQFANNDAASPTAAAFRVPSTSAGTSNGAGSNWTMRGSLSTGSGVSGDIVLQTGGTGAAATVQNTATNALVIKGATQNIQLPAITSDSGKTDASICEDTTNHALFSGSGTLGVCLGTSSARFKHDIAPLAAGLPEIMRLRPISYKLDADHGDPNKTLYGFTAEQMQPVLPKLVGLDDKGLPNSADYLGLVPVLVKAVQEQQAEIDVLKKQVANDNVVMAKLFECQPGIACASSFSFEPIAFRR